MQRTSPTSVLFTSYNLLDLLAGDSAEARPHYEIITWGDPGPRHRCARRPGDPGLRRRYGRAAAAPARGRRGHALRGAGGPAGPGDAALAFGGHGYHVGLMWRDGIEPVPGSLRCYGGRDFWHGLAVVTLDVGGTLIPGTRHLPRDPLQPGAAGGPE